jgi:hypothetical protein
LPQQAGTDALIAELVLLRKLMLLLLAKLGSDSDEIGMALGVPSRTVRNWLSFNQVKHIASK